MRNSLGSIIMQIVTEHVIHKVFHRFYGFMSIFIYWPVVCRVEVIPTILHLNDFDPGRIKFTDEMEENGSIIFSWSDLNTATLLRIATPRTLRPTSQHDQQIHLPRKPLSTVTPSSANRIWWKLKIFSRKIERIMDLADTKTAPQAKHTKSNYCSMVNGLWFQKL